MPNNYAERRRFLTEELPGLLLATGTFFTGTGGLIALSRLQYQKAENAEKQHALVLIADLNAEITAQGVGREVSALATSQDIAKEMGENLWALDNHKPYKALFSKNDEILNNAHPSYSHHSALYWETVVVSGGEIGGKPMQESLEELNNRLNQHAAHFGTRGDKRAREARRNQLYLVDSDVTIWSKELRLQFEERQLTRDIGAFLLKFHQEFSSLPASRQDELIQLTDEAIAIWIQNTVDMGLPLSREDQQSIPNSNPFRLALEIHVDQ